MALIATATVAHAEVASRLVQESFKHFVAADWEPQACEVFYGESSIEAMKASILAATFAATAQMEDEVVGFILMPRPTILGMLFVHPQHIGQGVGAALWEAARCHTEANFPETKTIELNATPYAVAAYRAMGFYPISEPFRRGGCVATRMACWLPGRALTSSENAP